MKLPYDEEYDEDEHRKSPMTFLAYASIFLVLLVATSILFFRINPEGNEAPVQEQSMTEPAYESAQEQSTESGKTYLDQLYAELDMESKNQAGNAGSSNSYQSDEKKKLEEIEKAYKNHTLEASDLDIWGMFNDRGVTIETVEEPKTEPEPETETESSAGETDPTKNQFQITLRNGSKEWETINPMLAQNGYDITKFVQKSDRMYYTDGNGKTTSKFGVVINSDMGNVDFAVLKNHDVDFAMLRVGYRAMDTGEVTLDSSYQSLMDQAKEANMPVGVYFESQAINVEEAQFEANFVAGNLMEKSVKYPVVICLPTSLSTTARTAQLSKEERTSIAKAFLDQIKAVGYTGMICWDSEGFVKEIDLSKLEGYDVWLQEETASPEYPYQYKMWTNTKAGSIEGIQARCHFILSFVDFEVR